MNFFLAIALALCLDWLISWPEGLYQKIGHPVTWLGRWITFLEAKLNQGTPPVRRFKGFVLVIVTFAVLLILGVFLNALPSWLWPFLIWPLLGARSLYDHVDEVRKPLEAGDLNAARRAVSQIVGRNPETLDAAGVRRAALESLAENTSDGVIAPLFWGSFFRFPGFLIYKAANTFDSMIGHRNSRYLDFGRFAARFDDVVNFIPARLTALIIALNASNPALLYGLSDEARMHRSPNAGWPEAAMARALGFRLSGPRVYDGEASEEPWVNADAPDPSNLDLARALAFYKQMVFGIIAFYFALGLIWSLAQ